MIKRWLKILAERIRLQELNKDNRVVIFLVCLLISVTIWLANALGKKYETTVSMPVHYTNLPNNKVLVEQPPKTLKVKIEAFGLTLLQHKIKLSINPITFNVRTFTEGLMENSVSTSFKIRTDNYLPQISRQLSTEIKVIDLSPDTLYFLFDNVIRQKKAINPKLDLSFENQYFLRDSITFEPDSVLVTGPARLVDTLKKVHTRNYRFKNLDASLRRNISIKDIDNLDIEPRRVVVQIPVSLYTEYIGQNSISAYNVPDSLQLTTFPAKVEVVCIVAFDDYSNIDASSFIFGVDFDKVEKDMNTLKVDLLRFPSHVKSLQYHPKEVEFLIESK